MSERRSLSKRVRRGLQVFAGLVRASNAGLVVGINEDGKLTRDERDTLADVNRAVEWIEHIAEKSRPKPRKPRVAA